MIITIVRTLIMYILVVGALRMMGKRQIAIAIGLLGISPSYIIIGLIVLAALYAIFVQTTNDSEQ